MPKPETKPKDNPTKAPPDRRHRYGYSHADFTDPDGEPVHIRNAKDVFVVTGNGAGGAYLYVGPHALQVSQSVEAVKLILDGYPEPTEPA